MFFQMKSVDKSSAQPSKIELSISDLTCQLTRLAHAEYLKLKQNNGLNYNLSEITSKINDLKKKLKIDKYEE